MFRPDILFKKGTSIFATPFLTLYQPLQYALPSPLSLLSQPTYAWKWVGISRKSVASPLHIFPAKAPPRDEDITDLTRYGRERRESTAAAAAEEGDVIAALDAYEVEWSVSLSVHSRLLRPLQSGNFTRRRLLSRLCALSQVSLRREFLFFSFFFFAAEMRLGTGHGSPALFILFFLPLLFVMD